MTSLGGHTLNSLLLAALLFNGCKEPASFVKTGPLFTVAESSSPAKVLVHVYWPREEQGRRKRLWVGLCDGLSEEIEPDRYTTLVLEPGPACLSAEILWDLLPLDGFAAQEVSRVELNAEASHTVFLRVEQARTFFTSQYILRQVEPSEADPEIRRCRRLVPLSPDELARKY
ncbi:MAG TPA: hypothetical protein VF179_16780 [Thermoanaerobaculia bacterium]|nr:hypothetical protein [Thermoanaerobaculia bacterium]